jgi:hypothetical protein
MLQILNVLQLILYIGLLAMVGQGLLFVLAGQKRDTNLFYQLFQVLNRPWTGLARWISPKRVAPHHVPWVAFFMLGVFYLAVTLAKIEHCISVAMQGCR